MSKLTQKQHKCSVCKARITDRAKTGRCKKHAKPWLGKKRSDEDKKKMSDAKRGRFGKKANNWRGGIEPVRIRIRKLYEYRQWRSDIFTRDEYTCQICGQVGGDLNVDHYPLMFAEILDKHEILTLEQAVRCDELWNINNGRVLCVSCHKETFTGVKKKPWQKKY